MVVMNERERVSVQEKWIAEDVIRSQPLNEYVRGMVKIGIAQEKKQDERRVASEPPIG
jgi:hypothetical protein